MGKKNFTGVRTETRRDKRTLIIDFPYTDKDGFRRRFRRDATVQLWGASVAEAARLMKRATETGTVETGQQSGTAKEPSITYRAYVDGPFAVNHMPLYRPATARRYRELHDQRVLAFFGEKKLARIEPSDYRAFAAHLHHEEIQTKGPLTLVRTVLRAAFDDGYLGTVPMFPPGLVKVSRKLPDAPTSEEVDVMLRALGWLGLTIALAALAGLRMGEALGMEVRDVDFDRHRLLVRRALSEEVSLTPKSGHEREVPMAATLEARLRDAVKNKLPRARVVLKDGATPRRQRVLYEFKKYLRVAGLKERSFHSLRHYFVSELLKCGASAEAVRVLAGHSKLEMTQRYAHAADGDLRAAIDKLGK